MSENKKLDLASRIKEIFSVDLRSLALFRMALGLLILVDLIHRGRDLEAHYSDFGILPRDVLLGKFGNIWHLSIHLLNGRVEVQFVLFLSAALFALMLLVGYRTRLATVVSWFFLISLHARNPMILQGGDIIFRLLLFWGMFLPLGARTSIDSALNTSTEKIPNRYLSIASVAILLQVGFIYWFAAALKTDSIWRTEGSAIYYALSIDQFVTPLGLILLQFPIIMKILTFSTFYLEGFGPIAAFTPFKTGPIRTGLVFVFIWLHVGFGLFMILGLFPYISSTAWLIFLPGWFWDKISYRFRSSRREGLKIYYDGDCGFCKKSVFILQTFCLLQRTAVVPAQENPVILKEMQDQNSWVVVDHTGQRHIRFKAVLTVMGFCPPLWPLSLLLKWRPLLMIGEKIYKKVASNRKTASAAASFLTWRPLSLKTSLLGQVIVIVSLVFSLFWNLRTINNKMFTIDPRVDWVGPMFRLDQWWNMFAPYPLKDDGWYVIPGVLVDGTEVDLFKGGGEISWDKPEFIVNTYPNQRWRKYLMNIWQISYKDHRLYYGRYLCRDWNRGHEGNKQLRGFEIDFMREDTLPDYQYAKPEKVVLWMHNCFKNLEQ